MCAHPCCTPLYHFISVSHRMPQYQTQGSFLSMDVSVVIMLVRSCQILSVSAFISRSKTFVWFSRSCWTSCRSTCRSCSRSWSPERADFHLKLAHCKSMPKQGKAQEMKVMTKDDERTMHEKVMSINSPTLGSILLEFHFPGSHAWIHSCFAYPKMSQKTNKSSGLCQLLKGRWTNTVRKPR